MVLGVIAAADFAHQEEILLAEIGGEFFDRTAEIPCLFRRDML